MSSSATIDAFKSELARLTGSFRKNISHLKSEAYDESALRNDYLSPLWRALGWDVENQQGATQPLREVQTESRVDIAGKKKRADYLFRTDGIDRFVCEAKKPREDLSSRDAYQAQRYAFNLKLLIAALTNFETLRLFVVGGKPDQGAPWDVCKQWHYSEYVEKAQELWDLFARHNVAAGSLDRFVANLPKRIIKGKARQGWLIVPDRVRTVDADFLAYIEQQREELAKDLVAQNPRVEWNDELLNECIQRILDRVLFVRICEDRDIDTGRTLENLLRDWQQIEAHKPSLYSRVVAHFNSLDESFNGALFSKGHESERLKVSDEYLANLITDLSSEDSPYLFSTLPVEILGSVYERFIGKAVYLTRGNRVKAELKPELRKAEGVYYTPRFIVNFIVARTVGRLIQGKSPKEVSKLKFVDPSCGSGSFLLRVFEVLCEYHLRWFQENLSQQKADYCYRDAQNSLQLTTHLKRQIMLNSVFGVDLDQQAVEVTMLSLYLKILEGETRTTLGKQHTLFPKETFLPDLSRNIKCGNSLVASDFHADEQLSLLESNDTSRVNAFGWGEEFPAVSEGGFDAVVGNPPYVRIQTLKEIRPAEAEYFKRHYATAAKGNYDIYLVFVEKGFSLLNKNGLMGYILPSKFLATDYGEPLRKLLSERRAVVEVVDFRHEQVFDGPTTYTCLLFLSSKPNETLLYSVAIPHSISTAELKQQVVNSSELSARPWTFGSDAVSAIIHKVNQNAVPLLELPALMSRGSSTGADDVFMVTRTGRGFQTRDGDPIEVEDSILRVPLYATDFGRYRFHPAAEERIIFPYTVKKDGYSLLSEHALRTEFPRTYAYLASRKKELKQRKQFAEWYSFSAPRNLDTHDKADLLVPLLADGGLFCLLPKKKSIYCLMASGGFSISIAKESNYPPEYILGILNSTLMFWLLQKMSNVFRGGWITCTKQYVGKLPIRRMDSSDSNGRNRQISICRAVKQMIALKDALASARTSRQKASAERQIAATERRIDQLVYELYELTETEIAEIENTQLSKSDTEDLSIIAEASAVLEEG
jgi:hypothetical protein